MTQPVQENSPERAQAATDYRVRQLARRPPLQGAVTPLAVFRAKIRDPQFYGLDDGGDSIRVHYANDLGDSDNIYWDIWDPSFDPSVFDTGPYEQTNNVTEGLVIAGVGLLKPGLYGIHALVDFSHFMDGQAIFRSNYDRGQMDYFEMGIDWDSSQSVRLDHWRYLWDEQDVFADGPSVEIVLSQLNTDRNEGTGPNIGAGEIWIPGGSSGAWGNQPEFSVAYFGPVDADPDFFPDSAIYGGGT